MPRFVDEYAPPQMPGYPALAGPRFSTQLVASDSGDEQANRRWQHPLRRFQLPNAVREQAVAEAVAAHFLVMGGPARTWPFRDPLDCASVAVTTPPQIPFISRLDQAIGTGDGVTTAFQLVKTYTRGGSSYQRPVTLPVVASVVVGVSGVDPATLGAPLTWVVTRLGGIVTFSGPPLAAAPVTAGFIFDVPVRFEADDSLDRVIQAYGAQGFADLTLIETRWRP